MHPRHRPARPYPGPQIIDQISLYCSVFFENAENLFDSRLRVVHAACAAAAGPEQSTGKDAWGLMLPQMVAAMSSAPDRAVLLQQTLRANPLDMLSF